MTEKIIDAHITTSLLGSGYAAVHMVLVDDSKLGKYWDVQQTGLGRYKTEQEAIIEAKLWSESDEIKYLERETEK